jgi:MFS family permease
MGALYTVAMTIGALSYRLPAPGWTPPGRLVPAAARGGRSVRVGVAMGTPQFWLLWSVLLLNVSAGIGILGMASPMIQEVFKGRVGASEAAGFTGLLSLFNIAGRIGWASLSDRIGRFATYAVFFALGAVLYAAVPTAGHTGGVALFVALFCVILTMYGGGFATIPAYLADTFGVHHVSAIHGRLLTAWSCAGVLGPVLVNYLRDWQLANGVAAALAYDRTLYLLAGLLVLGFVANLLIRPVDPARFSEVDADVGPARAETGGQYPSAASWYVVAAAWTAVGLPLAWGTWRTLRLAAQLFG